MSEHPELKMPFIIRNHSGEGMEKRLIDFIRYFKERDLYLRGIIPLVGINTTVEDVISEREAGHSKYTLKKMLNLALDGITSFSVRPLYWIIVVGLFFFIYQYIDDNLYSIFFFHRVCCTGLDFHNDFYLVYWKCYIIGSGKNRSIYR